MSKYDLMKFFSTYEGEVSEGDFTPEELQERLEAMQGGASPARASWKEKYFEYYDDVKDKSLKKQDW